MKLMFRRLSVSHQLGVSVGILLLGLWVVVGAVGFILIEGFSPIDAIYMTIITVSTVGFGEVKELSTPGRIFACFLIVAGLGTTVYTFTRLGQMIFEGELLDIVGRRRMKIELEKLNDHFIVCGAGRVGAVVCQGMRDEDVPFCVLERNPEEEPRLREKRFTYLIGDATEEELLLAAGIDRAAGVLALLASDADNLYLTITAKELNPNVRVIARATDERAELRLQRSGVDKVVAPLKIAGLRVLNSALRPTVVEFMELWTQHKPLQLNVEELVVHERATLAGATIAGAGIRANYGAIVVAIRRRDGSVVFNPDPNEAIQPGDTLVATGQDDGLAKLGRDCGND